MIGQSIQDAINNQIGAEQFSSQLYLAMSAHCEGKSFRGFAHWLRVQAHEETKHAMKLVAFLLDRGGRLALASINGPPTEFGSTIQVFERALEHEQENTARINALFDLARQEKDYPCEVALQWYVTEQVEEEATVGRIVDQLKTMGEQGSGIWYLDSKLGEREMTR